jgi:hypothetical protein
MVVLCLKVMALWLGKDMSEPPALDLRVRQTTNNAKHCASKQQKPCQAIHVNLYSGK